MQVHGIGNSDEERLELAAEVMEAVQLKRDFLWCYRMNFQADNVSILAWLVP